MKGLRKNILVPIDFSEASIYVAQQSLQIADFINGKVTLLYIIEKGDFFQEFFKNSEEVDRLRKEIEVKLSTLVKTLQNGHQCEIDYYIESGKVYRKIIEFAYENKVRFIVMARNSDFNSNHVGTNTSQVLAEAKNPVITIVNESKSLDFKNILVPLDVTKQTRIQVFNAIAFASHYKSAIHLVSVIGKTIGYRKSRIYSKIRKAKKTIEENNIVCTYEVFQKNEGPVYQPILEYGHKVNADLIMLMTHQEKYSTESYIGAFVQRIIFESDIPVLTLTSAASLYDGDTLIAPIVDPLNILNPEKEFRKFKISNIVRKQK